LKAYEVIVILDPALTEEEVEGQINEIKEQVAKGNGEVQEIQRWGKRRLAYLVKKRREGYYVLFRLALDPKTLSSLEKYLKVRFEEVRIAPPEKVEAKKPEEAEAFLEAKEGV